MALKFMFLVLILCAVIIDIKSDNNSGVKGPLPEHTRMKRAKYHPSIPPKFYKRPPISYPTRGVFSNTPPPNYMIDDEEPQFSSNSRPPKVSKRPTEQGLGDDDISNLVKYLSKQDLDKIIEFANEKEKYDNSKQDSIFEGHERPQMKKEERKHFQNNLKSSIQGSDTEQNFFVGGHTFNVAKQEQTPYKIYHFDKPYNSDTIPNSDLYFQTKTNNYPQNPAQGPISSNALLFSEESMLNSQISNLNDFIKNIIYSKEIGKSTIGSISNTDNDMEEEILPEPINLRQETDFDISFTNNVPVIVASNSYKVEDLGGLPLMNYNSKLDSVSSYKVPHYTVTAHKSQSVPTSNVTSSSSVSSSYRTSSVLNSPILELAPPASSAKEQSDAHLKAIKIWTHRSKGTAYTLHNDGSLSLERPTRLKTTYGSP